MRSSRCAWSWWLATSTIAALGACGDSGWSGSPGGSNGGLDGAGPTSNDGSPVPDGGGDARTVNPNPTISAWLGTNVSADVARVDITYQLAPFSGDPAKIGPNGYPVADSTASSNTDIGFVLPTGAYKISFKGTGSVAVSGIGALAGEWQSAAGEQRNTINITGTPGSFGRFLTITITNGPGQTVEDLHIYSPGFDYGTTATFLPQLLAILKPFRTLRFMDWEATNGSALADWAARPTSSRYGHSSFGEPYEHIAELVNETGKDAWLTVPEKATDDFITKFAEFMASHLDFDRIQAARDAAGYTTPFQLIVENSNETWNQGFSVYGTFLAAANADASRYTGAYDGSYGPSWMSGSADLMKVGKYEADRLVKIGNAFRTAFRAVGRENAVAPVLSGWALGTVYSDVGLRFIEANYGEPKNYISYVAHAPYFSTEDAKSGSLDVLFPALNDEIAKMDGVFADFAKLGAEYGIGIVAYEGGQGLTGTTHQSIKHLAQHDKRMYDVYTSYFALWQKHFDKSLFMHFSLAGTPGLPENIYQYGYWGSIIGILEDPVACGANLPTLMGTESIDSVVHHCPKYHALAEQVP